MARYRRRSSYRRRGSAGRRRRSYRSRGRAMRIGYRM